MAESIAESTAEAVLNVTKTETIRVLHVDDDCAFLKVAKQCLEMQGPFHVDTAGSVEEALAKLEKEQYDAIISDYQMPEKDGLEFLEILRKNGNTTPFIMFTGKGREEVAVKAWSLGADHYVNKTGDPETVYCELSHCLRSIVEKHFAEAQTKETVQKLQTIYQNTIEGITYVDAEENIVYANKAFADILGYQQDQLVNMNLHKIVDDENWAKIRSETERRRQGEVSRFEVVFLRSDGAVRNVLVSGAPLFDHHGLFVGTVGIVLDLTEQKKAMLEVTIRDKAIASMAIGVAIANRQDIVTYVNSAFLRMWGFDDGREVLGRPASELWHSKDLINQILKAVETEAGWTGEMEATRKDGSTFLVYATAATITDETGKPQFRVGSFTDITERKQMEKRTKESEEKYRNLVENSQDAIAIVNFNGNVLFANKAAERLTGYTLKEGKGLNIRVITPKRYWPKSMVMLLKARMGKPIPYFEYELKRKDGTIVPVETGGQAIFEDGKPVAIQIITREITERRKTEEALRRSEEKYRILFENAMDAIVTLDLKGNITAANNSALSFGYNKEDLVGKNILDFVSEDYRPAVIKDFSKVVQGEPARNETELVVPAGKILVEYRAGAMVEENDVVGMQVNIRDVTERKKSEELLRESEERFRNLFGGIQDPVGIFVGREGRLIDYNAAFKKSSGYTDEELKGKVFVDFVHPSDRDMVLEKYRTEYAEDDFPLIYEIRGVNKKGEPVPLELSVSAYKSKGKVIGIEVIHRDLTERRKVEQALKESEERYRSLVELAPDGIVAVNVEGIVTSVNRSFLTLLGFDSEEEIVGKPFTELKSSRAEGIPKFQGMFMSLLKGESSSPVEFLYVRRDGTSRWAEVHPALMIKDGKPAGLQAIMRDVTERKKAEEALRETKDYLDNLLNYANAPVIVWDNERKISLFNNASEALTGYKKEFMLGRNIEVLFPPLQKTEVLQTIERATRGEKWQSVEVPILCKDEETRIALWNSANIHDKDGNIVATIAQGQDITERKALEDALRDAKEKWASLTENTDDVVMIVDNEGIIQYINRTIPPYTPEETVGKTVYEYVPREQHDVMRSSLKKTFETGVPLSYVVSSNIPKIGTMWFETKIVPVKVDEKTVSVIMMSTDVTELRNAEERLKEANMKLVVTNEKLHVVGGLTRHDVRNKLSAVTGNAYLLRQKLTEDPKALEQLKDMEAAVRLVEKIFEFARIYEKLGTEQLVNIDVGKAVDGVVSLFSGLKGVKVVNECGGLTVLADSLLNQLFYNLVDNSLKYGEKIRQIKIHYNMLNADQLELVYEDDGVGIPDNMRSNLFKEGFTSGKGTGYGLFMIRRICEVYGWTIRETGKQGKGAQFTMLIPRMHAKARD